MNDPAFLNLVPKQKIAGRHTARGRVSADRQHAFYIMGDAYKAADNWTVVLATVPMIFSITEEMIKRAVPGSPNSCVVAQAFRAIFGKNYPFQVGAGITKIWDPVHKIELRFRTQSVIARAIPKFDAPGGMWELPPNIYKCLPICKKAIARNKQRKQGNRAADRKAADGGTVVVIARRTRKKKKNAAPSRTVMRNSRIRW